MHVSGKPFDRSTEEPVPADRTAGEQMPYGVTSQASEVRTAGHWVIAIPVTPDEQVDPRFGRAPDIAVAVVDDVRIAAWHVHHVSWDVLHDQSGGGQHHARVVRFIRDNAIQAVAAAGMGGGMAHTLGLLGTKIVIGVPAMSARQAVLAVAERLEHGHD